MNSLIEMHAHTSETSLCAKASAKELVERYIKKGYTDIVITDHFNKTTFNYSAYYASSWNEKVDVFMKGYNEAVLAAKGRINIHLGMELKFDIENCENDYLIYGVTEEFLRNSANIIDMKLPTFSTLAHLNGMLIFQAHPFRYDMTITRPKYLDGIEIYNGNIRHNSNNEVAELWAKTNGLKIISGSDFHEIGDEARGGIAADLKITCNKELVKLLNDGNYKIIKKI
ncbi:MAG: PHP domain-containing protein [Oscillospiraceae bacterium]